MFLAVSDAWAEHTLPMLTFRNTDDALAAGFVRAESKRVYVSYKECNILGCDTSGPIPLGLSFALRVEIPEEFTRNYFGVTSDKAFGQSVSVKLAQVSPSQNRGVSIATKGDNIVQMFSPQDMNDALLSARQWTDRWFSYNPEARERAMLRSAEARDRAGAQALRA